MIFRINNGASVVSISPPSANNGTFSDICFYNTTLGFAIAEYTPSEFVVATTEDGGNSWYYILAEISGSTFPFFRINCNSNYYGFYLYGFDSNPAMIYTYEYSYLSTTLQFVTSSPLKLYVCEKIAELLGYPFVGFLPFWSISRNGKYLVLIPKLCKFRGANNISQCICNQRYQLFFCYGWSNARVDNVV